MKKTGILLLAFFFTPLFLLNTAKYENAPNREKAKTFILDDFENSETWKVHTSGINFLTQIMKVVGCPGSLRGKDQTAYTKGKKFVLGVKTDFRPLRSAKVQISPPKPIVIPGHVFKLSVWVLGRNVSHKLYIDVVDFNGHVHSLLLTKVEDQDPKIKEPVKDKDGKIVRDANGKIKMQPKNLNYHTLAFTGWKQLEIEIPEFIPQGKKYSGTPKPLWIRSFTLAQNPNEVSGFYCLYLDELEGLIQKRESLEDPDNVRDNWVRR